ncbi:MAG: class I SAM-dependent methyltransferase [Candidatus Nanoarchaeia archaeon]
MANKKQHKNFDYWSILLQDTPASYKRWFKFEEEYLKMNIKENSKILEVGCGEGRSLTYLISKGSTLYGIDHDKNAVLLARNNLSLEGININISYMEANNLLFKNNVFDYVLSLSTPANFGSQKNEIYSEMKRVLKPEGEIIINVFNEDAFEERIKFYKKIKSAIKEIRGTTVIFKEGDKEFVSEQFSREDLEKICRENNLIPIEIRKKGIGYLCRFKK